MITLLDSKNVVMGQCVRGEASIRSYVNDVFVMLRVVEWEILEFIRPGGMKN